MFNFTSVEIAWAAYGNLTSQRAHMSQLRQVAAAERKGLVLPQLLGEAGPKDLPLLKRAVQNVSFAANWYGRCRRKLARYAHIYATAHDLPNSTLGASREEEMRDFIDLLDELIAHGPAARQAIPFLKVIAERNTYYYNSHRAILNRGKAACLEAIAKIDPDSPRTVDYLVRRLREEHLSLIYNEDTVRALQGALIRIGTPVVQERVMAAFLDFPGGFRTDRLAPETLDRVVEILETMPFSAVEMQAFRRRTHLIALRNFRQHSRNRIRAALGWFEEKDPEIGSALEILGRFVFRGSYTPADFPRSFESLLSSLIVILHHAREEDVNRFRNQFMPDILAWDQRTRQQLEQAEASAAEARDAGSDIPAATRGRITHYRAALSDLLGYRPRELVAVGAGRKAATRVSEEAI